MAPPVNWLTIPSPLFNNVCYQPHLEGTLCIAMRGNTLPSSNSTNFHLYLCLLFSCSSTVGQANPCTSNTEPSTHSLIYPIFLSPDPNHRIVWLEWSCMHYHQSSCLYLQDSLDLTDVSSYFYLLTRYQDLAWSPCFVVVETLLSRVLSRSMWSSLAVYASR